MQEPLIAFVHTPKSAGSTIAATLSTHGEGRTHVNGLRKDPAAIADLARRVSWLGGHLDLNELRGFLEPAGRPYRMFSAVRELVSHTRSHYNWLIEIRHRGRRFFDGHPKFVRDCSDLFAASDNSDPEVVAANLTRFPAFFRNYQSKFVAPKVRFPLGVRRTLEHYEFVATEKTLAHMIDRMVPGLQVAASANVSPYHFDRAVFDHPTTRDAIARLAARDATLYREVERRFPVGAPAGRKASYA
ncbi:MAG: hypothetical protein ACU0BS_04425 [Hasllibacter sp.]